MNPQRTVGLVTALIFVLAFLALLWVATRQPDVTPPVAAPATPPPSPLPAPPEAPELGAMQRRPLPAPEGVRPPQPPPDAPAAQLGAEQWRDYNTAIHEIVVQARTECLRPYAQQAGLGKVEVILDAVLWDGRVVDFGIRGLQDVPDHVLDCVADLAWSTPIPEHDIPGELRLQRAIPVDGG